METFNYYDLETSKHLDYNQFELGFCINVKASEKAGVLVYDKRKTRHLHFENCEVEDCKKNAQLMFWHDVQSYYECYACNDDLCKDHMDCAVSNEDYHKYFKNDIANSFEYYDKDLDLDIVLVCERCYILAYELKKIKEGGK